MDDSGYRGHIGGCVATTLGSVLHELGHAFDLGHTQHGIMARYHGILTFYMRFYIDLLVVIASIRLKVLYKEQNFV